MLLPNVASAFAINGKKQYTCSSCMYTHLLIFLVQAFGSQTVEAVLPLERFCMPVSVQLDSMDYWAEVPFCETPGLNHLYSQIPWPML